MNDIIKNSGTNQTIIRKNNHHFIRETKWDADYDGKIANISMDENNNGIHREYKMRLNNDDLANMLNMKSVNTPLHKRLEMDFNLKNKPQFNIEDISFQKGLNLASKPEPTLREPTLREPTLNLASNPISKGLYLASPRPNEEFVISGPSSFKRIDNLSNRKHRRPKSHVSHKVHRIFNSKKSSSSKPMTRKIYSKTTSRKSNR